MVADGDRSGPCCDVFRRRVLSIADHSLGPGWIAACQAVKGISLVGQHAAGQVLVRDGEGDNEAVRQAPSERTAWPSRTPGGEMPPEVGLAPGGDRAAGA